MTKGPGLTRYLDLLNSGLASMGACLLLLIACLLAIDVTFRGLLQPLQVIPELSVFAMIALAYLGLPQCEQRGEHIHIDFFLSRCSDRSLLHRISYLLSALCIAILLFAVFDNALGSYFSGEGTEGMITLKVWPVKVIMVIGITFTLCQILREWRAL